MADDTDTLRVRRVEVVDHRGRVRVVIGALDAEYAMFGICVRDTDGAGRGYLYTDFGGVEMGLAANGNDILQARVSDDGFGWVILGDGEGRVLRRLNNDAV